MQIESSSCDLHSGAGRRELVPREVHELVAAARVELDPVKRKAIHADVQWILHEEGSTIVPLFQNLVHGISDTIDTGGDILGAQPLDTFRVFEKWSFKA